MANDGRIFLQSIEFAPSSSPDEEDLLEEDAKNDLALAFANRSAVWNDRGEHALAIRDADLAFEAKYPLELQHKLYERKGQCFMALGNFFFFAYLRAKRATVENSYRYRVTQKVLYRSLQKSVPKGI